jgi:hypothetical protein
VDDSLQFVVRDPQGNVYGPANPSTLRQWVGEGRIIAGMHIAPRDTSAWIEVSTHPDLADLFPQPAAVPDPSPFHDPAPAIAAPANPIPAINPQPLTQTPINYSPDTRTNNILALLSMIAGIVGLTAIPASCVCCIGIPVAGLAGLAAIVMGVIGLMQIKASPDLYKGHGMAVAGIIMGAIGPVLAILAIFGAAMAGIGHP